jgi:hypothetical protein
MSEVLTSWEEMTVLEQMHNASIGTCIRMRMVSVLGVLIPLLGLSPTSWQEFDMLG